MWVWRRKGARVQTDPRKKPQTVWRLKGAKVGARIYYSTTIDKRKHIQRRGSYRRHFKRLHREAVS
nr:MAG TPA: hypothetical protein [Caudoviricetes sp.]